MEAEQAGAEMYLASFPPAGHTGPSLPRCARKSSRRSDQSRSRRGERETVPGRSLGKINTLQDWCQAAPQTSTPGSRQPRRVSLRGGKPPGPEAGAGLELLGWAFWPFAGTAPSHPVPAWPGPTELRAPLTHPTGAQGQWPGRQSRPGGRATQQGDRSSGRLESLQEPRGDTVGALLP